MPFGAEHLACGRPSEVVLKFLLPEAACIAIHERAFMSNVELLLFAIASDRNGRLAEPM